MSHMLVQKVLLLVHCDSFHCMQHQPVIATAVVQTFQRSEKCSVEWLHLVAIMQRHREHDYAMIPGISDRFQTSVACMVIQQK